MDYLVTLLMFSCTYGAEVLRPRGVSLNKASLYDPLRDFHCFDGSLVIPFSHVNDDYCDCQDGSDEPGTAACPNGFFHCNNIGHQSVLIPSSRVNDGLCDCCDASDEYATNASCIDNCNEMGRAAREEEERMGQEQLRGYELRVALVAEGKTRRLEVENRIEELKQEKEQAEAVKAEKEEWKRRAEEPEKAALEAYRAVNDAQKKQVEEEEKQKSEGEAREAFAKLDTDQDGVLTLLELQSQIIFDTNKDGEVSEMEAKFYLHQEDSITLDDFLISGWILMKPTFTSGKQMFQAPDVTVSPAEAEPLMTTSSVTPDSDDETYAESLDEEGDDYENGDDVATESPPSTNVSDADEEVKYNDETQRLIDEASIAREEFDEADRSLRDLSRELRNFEEKREKDYGPEDEFRTMDGECFEFTDREYTYRVCPFEKVIQKPKLGHGDTRLGQWGEWAGPEGDKYSKMKFTDGQGCWNGPARSTVVELTCGIENQLTSASEPSRCEYLVHMTTPAVCTKVPSAVEGEGEATEHVHSEL